MFLTGFNARTVNTLYVDKSLRWHRLIQSFSRTNRILSNRKRYGNVVCFGDLKERTDEAIALFANRDATSTVIVPGYEERLAQFREAEAALPKIVAHPDAVDALTSEKEIEAFVKAFPELMRIRSGMETLSEFDVLHLPMSAQEFEDFKSKYLDIEHTARTGGGEGGEGTPGEESILAGLDFGLELIRRDEINVAHILALLTALGLVIRERGAGSRHAARRRKQIADLLTSEVGLRTKAPLIRKFMDEVMPAMADDADLPAAFAAFWETERAAAVADIVAREKLDEEKLHLIVQRIHFLSKHPLGDEQASRSCWPQGRGRAHRARSHRNSRAVP